MVLDFLVNDSTFVLQLLEPLQTLYHFISGAGQTILSEKPVLLPEFQSTLPRCTHLSQKSLILNLLNY